MPDRFFTTDITVLHNEVSNQEFSEMVMELMMEETDNLFAETRFGTTKIYRESDRLDYIVEITLKDGKRMSYGSVKQGSAIYTVSNKG